MAIDTDFLINVTTKVIYYSATGSGTIYTVNELYSYLMDYFDESGTIDDTIPMTAQTTTSYTLTNGWFLDYATYSSHEYLNEGSIKTLGWDANTYDYGIRLLTLQASGYVSAVIGDIGREVGYSGGTPSDTGTLLAYNNTTREWWVRVDDTGDTFANTSTALDLDNGTGTGAGTIASGAANNLTGESVWANPFTIGTLVANTTLYLYQNNAIISAWWSTGHIDILFLFQESGNLIDDGVVTIYARQYTKLYDHFVADLSTGSRTPIPLAAFNDTNNPTGDVLLECSTGSGTFTEGELIGNNATQTSATALGMITVVSGTGADPDLTIYLVGDLTPFTGSDTVYSYDTSAQADVDTVSNTGINTGTAATITVTFGATSQDLSNGNGSRPYSVIIDCQQVALATVYERLKYLTRFGATSDIDAASQSVVGDQYEGIGDYYIPYDSGSVDDPFNDTVGETINGSGGFTGTLTSAHDQGTNEGFIIVRHTSGDAPVDGDTLTGAISGHTATVDEDSGNDPVEAISPAKQAPFGTFAGGQFFGARGVWITDYPAADANNFELIDSEGVRQTPPLTVPVTITNTEAGDRVSVFLSTGTGSTTVNKSQFTSHATNNDIGDNTFEIQETIPADIPTTGTLRVPIRDAGGKITGETRYTYTGWSTSTFTGVSPTLVADYDGNDTAYVPYIDEEATSTSVSESISYTTDREVVVRVRNTGMQPFQIDGTIDNSGLSINVIRNTDTIYQ